VGIQILQNVPLWVLPVLAALLAIGAVQMRRRTVSRSVVMIAPAAMTTLSVYGVVASFGASMTALGAWAIGVAAAIIVNERLVLTPRGVRYHAASGRFEVSSQTGAGGVTA
jgi:hypothetical protein